MEAHEVWGLLCWPISILIASFISSSISSNIGFPKWIVFIILVFDLAFILYAPVNLRKVFYSYKLYKKGWTTIGSSFNQNMLMVLIFVFVPIAIFFWFFQYI